MQDEEKQNALESLSVVLFDRDTFNIRNGEKAMVFGELHPVQQRGNSKRITYIFANKGIEYERPENTSVELSEEDHTELNEFVSKPKMIEELISMFAPTVIGHEDKKLAVILMYVGAPETADFRGPVLQRDGRRQRSLFGRPGSRLCARGSGRRFIRIGEFRAALRVGDSPPHWSRVGADHAHGLGHGFHGMCDRPLG